MAQRSQYFDSVEGDRIYSSADFSRHLKNLSSDGFIYNFENELEVSPVSPANMFIEVDLGGAWVDGRYFEIYVNSETLEIPTADPNNPRIDRVVVRSDLNDRDVYLDIITGGPAVEPNPPELTKDAIGWEISLAQIFVDAGTTSITEEDITDERFDEEVCGISEHPAIDSIELFPDIVTASIERTTNTDDLGTIEFENAEIDTNNFWTIGQPQRLTAPRKGLYNVTLETEISASVEFDVIMGYVETGIDSNTFYNNTANQMFSNHRESGVIVNEDFKNTISDTFYLEEGDYITAFFGVGSTADFRDDNPVLVYARLSMSLVVEGELNG